MVCTEDVRSAAVRLEEMSGDPAVFNPFLRQTSRTRLAGWSALLETVGARDSSLCPRCEDEEEEEDEFEYFDDEDEDDDDLDEEDEFEDDEFDDEEDDDDDDEEDDF